MFQIDPYAPTDLPVMIAFIAGLQDYERIALPELEPGEEVGASHAERLLRMVAARRGAILMARAGDEVVGFACAWVTTDDDPLLRDEARMHAYLSDIFVREGWRRRGVGRRLLEAMETEMVRQGCRRMRLHCKATNLGALQYYAAAGYRPHEILLAKSIG